MRFCKKNSASEGNESLLSDCRAQPVLCKNSASECNESLFSDCRAQPVLCKNSASERNESLFSDCRVQPVLFKNSASERNDTLFSDCLIRSGMYKKKAAGQVRSASPSIPSGMCRCVRFPAPQSCKRLPCGFIHRCRLSSQHPPSSCGCP